MNDTICRWALDGGCTDIMYLTIEYLLSYTNKGKSCECIVFEKLVLPLGDLNLNSHHCNSMRYHWATTPPKSMKTLGKIKYIYLYLTKSLFRLLYTTFSPKDADKHSTISIDLIMKKLEYFFLFDPICFSFFNSSYFCYATY